MILQTASDYQNAFEQIVTDLTAQIGTGRKLVHGGFGDCTINFQTGKYELLSECGCAATLCTVGQPLSEDSLLLISQWASGDEPSDESIDIDTLSASDYVIHDFGLRYGVQYPIEFINGFDKCLAAAKRNDVEEDCYKLGARVRAWAESVQTVTNYRDSE